MRQQGRRRARHVTGGFEAEGRGCVERIMVLHRGAILLRALPREAGLEDTVISDAPLQSIGDGADRFSDCFEYAAFAMEYIAVFHPFAEGNKRTALAVVVAILNRNGLTLPDTDAVYVFVREVASGLHSREDIACWLRGNAIGSRPAS